MHSRRSPISIIVVALLFSAFPVGFAGTPAQAQGTSSVITYPVITPQNASKLAQVGSIGYGVLRTHDLAPDGKHVAVGTTTGIAISGTSNLSAPAHFIKQDTGD